MHPLVSCAPCSWRGTQADLVEARPAEPVCPACGEPECAPERSTFSRAAAAVLAAGAFAGVLAGGVALAQRWAV